jgi:hypothetical protein
LCELGDKHDLICIAGADLSLDRSHLPHGLFLDKLTFPADTAMVMNRGRRQRSASSNFSSRCITADDALPFTIASSPH